MKTFTKICLHFSVIFLAVLPFSCSEPVETKRFKPHEKIDVMTRSLYIGMDISSYYLYPICIPICR
jgi:hypothetical protein